MADLSYPLALVGTLVVEVPLVAALLPRVASVSPSRAAAVDVVVNAISHPLLWFVLLPALDGTGAPTLVAVAAAETAVWLFEATGLRVAARTDWSAALAVAAVANLASVGVGLLLWAAP